jgi:hypothetical protein
MRMLRFSYVTSRMALHLPARLPADRLDVTEVLDPVSPPSITGKLTGFWSLRAHGVAVIAAPFVALLAVLAFSAAPALASAPPLIEDESVSNVTEHDATLEARIDPEGLETTYEIWVAEQVECQADESCPIELGEISQWPVKHGQILAGDSNQAVSADLTNLKRHSSYSFWVVATNSAGTITTQWSYHKFHALPAGAAPPMVEGESVSKVTEDDATLEAQIDPEGLETAYEFQIDTNGSYNYTKSACPLGECEAISVGVPLLAGLVEPQPEHIPAGSGDQAVSLDLESIGSTLQPGVTYHYRVIASNGSGPTVEGPDQMFTTPSQSAFPPEGGSEPLPSSSSPSGGGQLVGSSGGDLTARLGGSSPSSAPDEGVRGAQVEKVTPKKGITKCAKGKKLSHGKCVRVTARVRGRGRGKG